jgi:catechol 2,3-dioxygenase-like lactoylglutathione lyase family enzyme
VCGLHHIQFLVTDLDESLTWFQRVFGVRYQPELDHHDAAGARFAIMMTMPGLEFPVQLRYSPDQGSVVAGYRPITFGVADVAELRRWCTHLDECGIAHSGMQQARVGQTVDFSSPDGTTMRLYTLPVDGVEFSE